MTYRSGKRVTALHQDLAVFKEASIDSSIFDTGALPYLGQVLEVYDFVSIVILTIPYNFIRSRHVQSETEWRFVLPHLSCYVVPPAQLVSKNSEGIEEKTTNAEERFCCKELDFGIGIVWLHQACGVGCPWTHSRSMVFAPIASPILKGSSD